MNPSTRSTRPSRTRRTVAPTTAPDAARRGDDHFPELAQAVREQVHLRVGLPFFTVHTSSVLPLFDVFLAGFESPSAAQTHRCHCCRHFIERYGNLVTIDENGELHSVMWSMDLTTVPREYRRSVARLREAVEGAAVTGVFYDRDEMWGNGPTYSEKHGTTWSHFQVQNPRRHLHPLLSPMQDAAVKQEEFHMLGRALEDYDATVAMQARALLESETMFRGEKVLGVAQWFVDVHAAVDKLRGQRRRARMWKIVAGAPLGFAHVRSGMIGTLLDDLKAGKPIAEVKRAFEQKMDPLKYQRAQAAPSAGNIARAERIVAEMGTAGALRRRYARLTDVQLLWQPTPAKVNPTPRGVFSHLLPPARGHIDIPGDTPITWMKFLRDVLPRAERIDVRVPRSGAFIALVTNVDPGAPPMLQWDREDARNPVSWYVYRGGSRAEKWNLSGGSWASLSGITRLPSRWNDPDDKFSHHGDGVILLIDGARDMSNPAGGGMFTENLRSEYHEIRRTLEAHYTTTPIEEAALASACGLDLRKGGAQTATVRVLSNGTAQQYTIDRWE